MCIYIYYIYVHAYVIIHDCTYIRICCMHVSDAFSAVTVSLCTMYTHVLIPFARDRGDYKCVFRFALLI